MSLLLHNLLREPALVEAAARPASRRRYDDALFRDPWSVAVLPQVFDAMDRINDFAHEIDHLAKESSRLGGAGDMVMKRASDGTMQLAMDVHGYKPEHIKINVVDNSLVVEGKSEQNNENSYHKSEFKQWFKLPEDCKLEEIKSNLTADNRLLISLPSNKPAVEQKMRSIPITIDKPAAVDQQKVDPKQNQKK